MFTDNYAFLVILFLLKCVSCSSTNDVIGPKLAQQPDVSCSSFKTSTYDRLKMYCTNGDYNVQMTGMPEKNFTNSLFCPPSPKFSYYFWDDPEDEYNNFNTIVCKLQTISRSKTIVMSCEQIVFNGSDIYCNNTYVEDEKEFARDEESPSYSTTFTSKVSSTTRTSSAAVHPFTTTTIAMPCRNEHNIWMYTTFGLIGSALIALVGWLFCSRHNYKKRYQQEKCRRRQLKHEHVHRPGRSNPYVVNNIDELMSEQPR